MVSMTNADWSLVVTSLVVVAVLLLRWYLLRSGEWQRGMVVGGDLFTKTLVELVKSPDLPAFAILGWMTISAIASLVGPATARSGSYVFNPTAMFVATNYIVLVPLLFGSYVFLIVSVGHFEAANFDRIQNVEKRRVPWLTVSESAIQAALLAITLVVQWLSIRSEIGQPYPCSPWIHPTGFTEDLIVCGNHKTAPADDLSVPGIFYYALRGIDAFIALGLVGTIFCTLWRRYAIFGRHTLSEFVFPKLAPTREVGHVGTGLLACILFGSLVTFANGLGLWAVAAYETTPAAKRKLFFDSTWVVWAVLTVAASAAATRLILWLQQRIRDEANARRDQTLAQYAIPLLPFVSAGSDPEEARRHADALSRDLAIRLQIGEVFAKATTWPLPLIALPAALLAFGSQSFNIAKTLYIAVFAHGGP